DGTRWETLRIDGGMAANDWMAQDLADMLGVPVERPAFVETTALGAAMLAAAGVGLYADLASAAAKMRGSLKRFEPEMDEATRVERLERWRKALAAA
ncbi:MAG: FGGY-family carbohydrate kinase, partial [Pseudomonadota bacterium]